MTEKSNNQGSTQNQNTAQSTPSPAKPIRILPKVDPAKTINLMQDGADPNKIKK